MGYLKRLKAEAVAVPTVCESSGHTACNGDGQSVFPTTDQPTLADLPGLVVASSLAQCRVGRHVTYTLHLCNATTQQCNRIQSATPLLVLRPQGCPA
jgi:hypothetical protein